jgi:hypothetical protein
MFAKSKVSQSMIDAVNTIISETKEGETLGEAIAPIKEPTKTGMKVYGRSYGNSAKAKQDQTKSSVDDLKGPKSKDMKEELKGDQHKIDKNKNKKIDSHDFAILRGEKKVKEEMTFKDKLIEAVRRSDIPAYLRKARGDAPLTPAEVKGPSKDAISHSQNLAKARNEEVEEIEEVKKPTGELKDACWKGYTAVGTKMKGGRQVPNCVPEEVELEERKMTDSEMKKREDIVKGMKKGLTGFKARYGADAKSVMYATATKNAMKEETVEEETEFTETTNVPFDKPYKKISTSIKDKSGAVHTPMSRARDLAQKAFKKVQDKTKIKD